VPPLRQFYRKRQDVNVKHKTVYLLFILMFAVNAAVCAALKNWLAVIGFICTMLAITLMMVREASI
jgi:hypothetical protein